MDISGFKPIEGFGGRYLIDRDGNVLSVRRYINKYGDLTVKSLLLRPAIDRKGYKYVILYKGCKRGKHYSIHRLVAKTFLANPYNKRCVCHKDNNPLNCNVNNLYWGTDAENIQQARADGLFKNSLPVAKLDSEGNVVAVYLNQSLAGTENDMSKSGVANYFFRTKNKTIKNPKWKKITRAEYEYYKNINS